MANNQYQPATDSRTIPRPRRRWLTRTLVILLVVALAASGFWFAQYRKALRNNPATQQQQLVTQLSKLIEMPSGQPVITTVIDKSKLTNPTLASLAHNGDRLFIFTKSKRLVLYRPSDKKVVDMLTIQTS
jgi:hypothetical protein